MYQAFTDTTTPMGKVHQAYTVYICVGEYFIQKNKPVCVLPVCVVSPRGLTGGSVPFLCKCAMYVYKYTIITAKLKM